MKLNYDIHPLDDGEIAGKQTINPIVNYLLGMRSLSELLTISPNGRGSVNFDFDTDSLVKIILGMIKEGEALNFSFLGTFKSNGSLSVTGGKVLWPDSSDEATISSKTISSGNLHNGHQVYVRLTAPSTGTLEYGSPVTHTLQTGNDEYRVTLPILTTLHTNAKGWYVKYHHVGDFAFTQLPPFWINGWDKSSTQSLDHVAGSNSLIWNTYEPCDEEE